MATVKGVWVFNETITKIPVSENVNFSVTFSDGHIINYDRMFISGNDLGYKQAGQSAVTCAYYHSISPNRWTNEIWRTVDFGTTEQTVTDAFYTWLTANAVGETAEEPEPEESEVTQYLIRSDTLTAIADGFRSSRGTTQKYTLDEMAVLAAEKTSGGGSMFASTASGRIPEYEKGTANSEFTLNFESSAIGALQEG